MRESEEQEGNAQGEKRIIKNSIARYDMWTRIFRTNGYSWKEAQRKAEEMVEGT